ncbi:MAG: efflux RND transporter periplasmic adaptor subunit, partial [Roseiarcus sp.]
YVYRSQPNAAPETSLIGAVRETEIHIAPDITGRLRSVLVSAGQQVRKGDLLAVLSSPELTASVYEAGAAAGQARANRDNVFAGVRKEEIDIASDNVRTAEANLVLARQQYDRAAALASKSFMSKQQLDETTASLHTTEAALELARAIDARNKAGPTKEERESADANVLLAEAARADIEAQLDKTKLLAPVDGVIGLLVAQPGEIIAPGQSVMTMTTGAERWFTFTVREDHLHGITIGSKAKIVTAAGKALEGRVTELRPLGEFATWRAARAVGDHDLNSFLLRVDPLAATRELEPGMTVWLERAD